MKNIDIETTRNMLLYTADQVIANKSLLTEIDSKTGDGDHGIGMARGMEKVKERLSKMSDCHDIYELFYETGKAMLMSMGGASGVIFGTLFMGGSSGHMPLQILTVKDLTLLFSESLEKIKIRGKASVGDKTMVDALEPAVLAMQNYSEDILSALLAAAKAAETGVENTKKYTAKYGRAKSLMERSIGFQDAGATSTWIIFRSMYEFLKGKQGE